MKRLLFLFIFQVLLLSVYGQEPISKNYTSSNFQAHRLIWDFTQDKYQRLWMANNDGILRFDGNNWRLFKTQNPVRSLAITKDGEIYAACLNDLGLLQFNKDGSTTFNSFKKHGALASLRATGDEKVIAIDNNVYFCFGNSLIKIVRQKDSLVAEIIREKQVLGIASYQNKLIVNLAKEGLTIFNNNTFTNLLNGVEMASMQISKAISTPKGLLIFTNYDGVFLYHQNKVSKMAAPMSSFAEKGVAGVCLLPQNKIAVGTLHHGVQIFNEDFSESQTVELPSNEIYALHSDHEGNLWTAHLKGLTHTLLGLPIKDYSKFGSTGNINDLVVHEGQLIVATTAGLFSANPLNGRDFTPLKEVSSECWDLMVDANALYISTTNGLYVRKDKQVKNILPNQTILGTQRGNLTNVIYAFGVSSVYKIEPQKSMSIEKIAGINELVQSVVELKDGTLLFGTLNNGVVVVGKKISLPESLLNGRVSFHSFNGQMIANAKDATYVLESNQQFKDGSEFAAIFNQIKSNDFYLDQNFWVFTDKQLRQVGKSKLLGNNFAYAISGRPTAIFQNNNKVWAAFEDKLYQIDLSGQSSHSSITAINFSKKHPNTIHFSGFFLDKKDRIIDFQEYPLVIDYEDLPVEFEFGIASFIQPEKNHYSYQINGLNEDWSDWENSSKLVISSIRPGIYELKVKGKNAMGVESAEASIKFQIKSPWYLSSVAYLVYFTLVILFIYLLISFYHKRLIFKNKLLEKKIQERTKELIQEKEKSDHLLLNIIPHDIAEELKAKGSVEAQLFSNVSVLFTDFEGFTQISEQLTPKELVNEIHRYFTTFDSIIDKYGIEKIKTIGDAYLAVSGLPNTVEDHATRITLAALEICKFVNEDAGKFDIRIGINSGPVVAGIVGVKKFQYDIWGDTVNTASRMESSGAVGRVNISMATYHLIKNNSLFKFEPRGLLKVKGKGEVEMYFVEMSTTSNV